MDMTRLYAFVAWFRILNRVRPGLDNARQAWRLSSSR